MNDACMSPTCLPFSKDDWDCDLVASTAWQTLFLKLENKTKYLDEDLPYKTMFRMAPRSSQEFAFISRYFFNFIIVRHPFTRLVSAYKDRIARCKMKAEWYNSGGTIISSLKPLYVGYISSVTQPGTDQRTWVQCSVWRWSNYFYWW